MSATLPEPHVPTCDELIELQDGVLSRTQARRAGMSEDQWQWRLDTGRWQRLLPGVAVSHSGAATAGQRAWAAVLYVGPGSYLTGDAALRVHGVELPEPRTLDVVCERQVASRSVEGEGVRVHTHRVRQPERWSHPVRQPPVLRIAPAVLHAAAFALNDRAAETRVTTSVQQKRVRPADLRASLEQMPSLRRRSLVRTVLDDVEFGAHAASELDFLRFLRRHGLPLPDELQRQVRVGALRYLDGWWQRQRVAAEVDGAHHRLVSSWEADVLRGNDVQLAEKHDRLLLLRFTMGNLRHDEERVVTQLRAALL